MSSFSLVGVNSGVATLASVDATGNLQCKDSALITANHNDLVAIDAVLDTSKLVLDNILSKNTEIETSCNALISANHIDLVAIDAVLDTSKLVLDNILTKNGEIDTVLDASKIVLDAISASLSGTLAVSAGTISAVNTVVISGASVSDGATQNSSSVDITGSRSCSVFGNLTDVGGNIKVQVSLDNSNWIEKTDDYITMSSSGDFHKLVSSDVRYVRISYANSSGSAQTMTANISVKS